MITDSPNSSAPVPDQITLDDETRHELERWSEKVLPLIADECKNQALAEAKSALHAARAEGQSPDAARKRLARRIPLWLGYSRRYLTASDVKSLNIIREQIATTDSGKNRMRIAAVSVGILAAVFLAVSVALSPGLIALVPTFLLLVFFLIVPSSLPYVRRKAIETMGAIGSALVSVEAYGLLIAAVMVLNLAGGVLVGRTTRTDNVFMSLICMLLIAQAPTYIAFIHRVRNNREIVARLLGLPGYEEELETSSKSDTD